MKKPINDIKVLDPGDKLIILAERLLTGLEIDQIKKTAAKFIKDEKDKYLIVSNLEIYIMRKGSKVLLKDAMNEEIEKEGGKSEKQKV